MPRKPSKDQGRRPRLTPAMADVRRAVREWASESGAPAGSLHLVALSGGGDSLALAWAAAIEVPKAGFLVGGVIVDHQLQEGSSDVAAEAARQAEALGLNPVVIKTVTVGVLGGPEEAARIARYQAYREALLESGAHSVLLAHTEDDQAETVLLGLARGSGPSSLKGMAAIDGPYVRPLLGLPRATLRQALLDAGLSWWEDPHNEDVRYARVRVRQQVLPVLEAELGPGVAPALARTAALFRADSDALDEQAAVITKSLVRERSGKLSLEVSELEGKPTAITSRVLRQLVARSGAPAPSFAQMEQMLALLNQWRGQSAVALSGATLERRDGVLYVSRSLVGSQEEDSP
jgi:tRNA(Ile)-lysidine synthase